MPLKWFPQSWRDSGITGILLSTIVVTSTRETIWPIYLKMRGAWNSFHLVPESIWAVTTIYFALWIWLVVFLLREGEKYSGMILDAIYGGALTAVTVALLDENVRSGLRGIGFGEAPWIAFLSGAALILHRAARKQGVASETPKTDSKLTHSSSKILA